MKERRRRRAECAAAAAALIKVFRREAPDARVKLFCRLEVIVGSGRAYLDAKQERYSYIRIFAEINGETEHIYSCTLGDARDWASAEKYYAGARKADWHYFYTKKRGFRYTSKRDGECVKTTYFYGDKRIDSIADAVPFIGQRERK